jgi:hypothetical protein
MNASRSIFLALLLLVLPAFASAATFVEQKTLVVSSSTVDNAYLAGTSVTVSAPLPADLVATGGTVTSYSTIAGDALVAAGTVDLEQAITGDVRAVGARVNITGPVGGDAVVAGAQVNVSGGAHEMRIAGANVTVSGGAHGPVTIYGADVTLSGTYDGDVEIIASDHFTLGENTHIHGALRYNAPTQVVIPSSSAVDGGATYTGSYAYVPTNAEAHKFAIAGAGIFFMVRALAVMIVAALIAGLFPRFTVALAERAYIRRPARLALLALLGFGVLVTTPVLCVFLLVSFVGTGLALLLLAVYWLFIILSYIYAGILTGGLAHRLAARKRSLTNNVSWKDALLGMLIFFVIGSVPYLGWPATVLAVCFTLGALVSGLYAFAFPRDRSFDD